MANKNKEFNVDFVSKFIDELNKKFITRNDYMNQKKLNETFMRKWIPTIKDSYTTTVLKINRLYIWRELVTKKNPKPMNTEFIEKFEKEFNDKFISRSELYKPFIDNAIKNNWVQYIKINKFYYIWRNSIPEYTDSDIMKFKKEIGPYTDSIYTFTI